MTLTLPQYDGTPETLQFILDTIAQSFPLQSQNLANGAALGVGSHASGTASLVWSGANGSAVLTVLHGVTKAGKAHTPAQVIVSQNGSGGPSAVVAQVQNVTDTTFDLYGEFRTGTATVTIPFGWIAIG